MTLRNMLAIAVSTAVLSLSSTVFAQANEDLSKRVMDKCAVAMKGDMTKMGDMKKKCDMMKKGEKMSDADMMKMDEMMHDDGMMKDDMMKDGMKK